MSEMETVATGRAKRSTAGNRLRELLDKAHLEDDDEMFREEEGDEEFEVPQDIRDVYLEDFADTDEEVELDSDEEERRIRREERRKAKGKGRAVYDPFAAAKPRKSQADPTSSSPGGPNLAEALVELDPSLDPSSMAPSTLILTLRQKRREAKRLGRSQAIRSTLRASTLRTEETILEKEKEEKELAGRKGRKAMHEGGEARGVRPLTQAELIAEALEEEERNRESLRDWVRREEERRELRRVGRKRVRGPRWTWISRTVGKLVEEVGGEETVQERPAKINKRLDGGETSDNTPVPAPEAISVDKPDEPQPSDTVGEGEVDGTAVEHVSKAVDPPNTTASNGLTNGVSQGHVEATVQPPESAAQSSPPQQLPRENPTSPDAAATTPDQRNANPAKPPETTSRSSVAPQLPPEIPDSAAQYARNYLILSQVPGGLPAELALVLGDHVHWDEMQYIPHRNRPINRRPTISPFSGQTAKYRHPATGIPYADVEEAKRIQALLDHRYIWSSEAGCWFGGEEDMAADGAGDIPGWHEAIRGGWLGGKEIVEAEEEEEEVVEDLAENDAMEVEVEESEPVVKGKKGKGGKNGKIKSESADDIELREATNSKKQGKGQKGKGKAKL